MRAKYTVKVPGTQISPPSFDLEENCYFSTHDAFYRVSNGRAEQISGGEPSRQVLARMIGCPNQLVSWPPLALSGNNMFLPGPNSMLFLVDPEKGPLWEHCSLGRSIGIVPCSLGGCFLLSELNVERNRQYAVEKIDHLGNREWEQTFLNQPFHTFGPPNGRDKLLFFHGDDWACDYMMRLVQLDAGGNMICVDEFMERGFKPLWAKDGSLFLVKNIAADTLATISYEIRKYHKNAAGDYCLTNQWSFPEHDPGCYIGGWGVSPSGNYLCYTGGSATSQGHWSNKVILFSLEGQGSIKRIFINQDTPINLSPTPDYAAPLVTDSGIVLSAWYTQKGNPIFLTDFSNPEIPMQQVRRSSRKTIFMEEHDSKLYLFENAGLWIYLSVFDNW